MEPFEKTFDNAAAEYEKTRPQYADGIFADIFARKPIGRDSDVLEIGMGTGKASRPFLDTQCRFVGIEPGEELAALARARFAGYPNCAVRTQTLQDFDCGDGAFDLIYAATAFHWIPEEYGYRRVYGLLKPGGVFARFAYHAGRDQGRTALSEEIQALYDAYMHTGKKYRAFGGEDAAALAAKALSYGFSDVSHRLYHTTKDFTAEEYLSLLRTYPDHMRLAPDAREKLFSGICRAIEKNGGVMTVYYTMDLELAGK